MQRNKKVSPIRALSLALAICLLASCVLAGCSKQPEASMGRYVEEALSMPENMTRLLGSVRPQDGGFIFYGSESGAVKRYFLSPSGETSGEEVAWLGEIIAEGGSIMGLSEAGGTVYAYYAMGSEFRLVCSTDGETYEIIDMPDWGSLGGAMVIGGEGSAAGDEPSFSGSGSVVVGGDDEEAPPNENGDPETSGNMVTGGGTVFGDGMAGAFPMGIVALDDGFLVLYAMDGVSQYDAAGKLVRQYSGMGSDNSVAIFEDTLAIADVDAKAVKLYDLASGKETDSVRYDGLDDSTYVALDGDGLFIGDSDGILRRAENDWELVVDGGLTSLIMPNLVISDLLSVGNGDYIAFLGDGDYQLMRFTFDETIPAEPDTVLEVYSLYDNNTIRSAIGEFQRTHPNVRVNLTVGMDGDSGATAEDVIRALNTQLIAGKGPDIIVLDGLPIESYIEKGVLTDITELANRLVSEQDLMENLAGAYEKDGKVYGLPSRFIMPVMLGEESVFGGIGSLSELVEAVETHLNDDPTLLRAPESVHGDEGMLIDYYEACVDSWTNPDGSLDETALAQYLSDMQTLNTLLKEITPETQSMISAVATLGGGGMEAIDLGSMDIKNGEASMHIQKLSGLLNFSMIASDLGDIPGMGISSLFNENKYSPQGGVGIVSASKQQDLAESFLELLMSGTVQDKYLYDGFPVNGSSLEKMLNERLEEDKSLTDMGFLELCNSLNEAVFVDEVVREAVKSQISGLLSGAVSPEQAAANVVESTRLYLAE